jgi:hypothetical protein
LRGGFGEGGDFTQASRIVAPSGMSGCLKPSGCISIAQFYEQLRKLLECRHVQVDCLPEIVPPAAVDLRLGKQMPEGCLSSRERESSVKESLQLLEVVSIKIER